jgi:hypothetical protein
MTNAIDSSQKSEDTNMSILVRRPQHHKRDSRGDTAWAYSLSVGPTNGYPVVNLSSSTNAFIELENQFPLFPDVTFSEAHAPSSGTIVTFNTPGEYYIEFSITASVDNTTVPATIGIFQGSHGAVPNTLPNGNLFWAGDDFNSQFSSFVILNVNEGDTIALGNAAQTQNPSPPQNLVLDQTSYTSGGNTTVSTTAEISIRKIDEEHHRKQN